MKKQNLSDSGPAGARSFSIVAIGAASGGLSAFTELLKNLSPKTGMAFLFLYHPNDPEADEGTARLVEATELKVVEPVQEVVLAPDHIYLIPAGQDVQISDDKLVLSRTNTRGGGDGSVDRLFSAVAKIRRNGMIGVLLSGKGLDGTTGLKAIKIAGGITFLQEDPATIVDQGKSAMLAGYVDLVLSPVEIGRELAKIGEQPGSFSEIQFGAGGVSDSDENLQHIMQLLKRATGIDFTHYKISTIKRRIVRRMLLYKLTDLKSYHEYLKRHSNEITVLYHDLLINVTCFFRDADSMEYLRKTVLPQVLRSKSADEQVRIWVPACSSGEEAYSLAILLTEMQEELETKIPVQIFGTDLSEIAITKARLGIYSPSDLADIPEIRISKFFARTENNQYRVEKRIRDLCVFAQHNVFKDPPFSRLDVLSCCNFFIYLDNVLQQKCIALFYYALNPNGFLILGKSETISSGGQQLFSQVEKRFKVYKKKPNGSPRVMAEINYRLPASDTPAAADRKRLVAEALPELSGIERSVDDILYSKYIPAAIVINQEMEILQFRGSTNLYLEPSRGKASFQLMKMARPGLTFDLRNLIHKAQVGHGPVRKAGVSFKVREEEYVVALEVIPLPPNHEEKLLLVIFEEQSTKGTEGATDFSRDETVRKLTEEMTIVRNDMQAIIDAHEANKEELQSANEEIISSNEELQSINEELETSKEEVESANEELTAINAELQMSNEQLMESQEYAEAIFATIREGVLVLNTDFRVKMANAAFYRTFHTEAQDIAGRLFYEMGDGQWNKPEIKELINNILLHDRQFDSYEMQYTLPTLGLRTLMVNGRKVVQKANKQELMLLAFEDITDRKRAEALNAEREEWFRNMANNAPVMIWTAGPDGLRNFYNASWLSFTGRPIEQEMGDGWIYDVMPEDKEAFLNVYHMAFQDRKPFMIDYRLRRFDGEYRWVKAIGRPTFSTDGQFTGLVGICTEIHDAKIAHTELERVVSRRTYDLQQLNKELKKSNSELQQFAYVASHDLQEPLRKIMIFSDRLTSTNDLPAPASGFVEKIAESAERMSQLIHDLLDFSKAVRAQDHFQPTDLSAVLRTVLEDFDLLIKEKNAMLITGDLPKIDAIPLQMEQLFHNLISNALKFSREKTPPVIKISSRSLNSDEAAAQGCVDQTKYMEIIFEDNGIGFSNEYAEQIFVIFQRLNSHHEYPGTGIGLALCRKIVDNHGGRMFAHSIESIHTEFHVILPEKQPQSQK
ncbi:MAG TPA: CheR family methyltransferase [Puia sp.]|jgi:two-component system CheB/CheR fusion protein|nr:CheR family methyltransferase [Puia sp.]